MVTSKRSLSGQVIEVPPVSITKNDSIIFVLQPEVTFLTGVKESLLPE